MQIPKFHSRKSLIIGMFAGWFLVFSGIFHSTLVIGIVQELIGAILAIHCLDMLRYWRKHRIVKIEKTDTHRIIHKK